MGITAALTVIFLWAFHLLYILNYAAVNFYSPLFYLHILLQAYLYTGLFITAHDSMHRTISSNERINRLTGIICTLLYAGLSYNKLLLNHKKHHLYPGTKDDPDFSHGSNNFFIWWFKFLMHYASFLQVMIMAAAFNLLKFAIPEIKLWLFWVLPAFISSLQLFYFGTYLPHKEPHDDSMGIHKARTQNKNHLWAMISCYFFGYHLEHHTHPHVPWWRLYKIK
jgi:beta-carotene ketolase (CrtW type)